MTALIGEWVLRSLWQGSLVAAAVVLALSVLRRPEHRHAASLVGLAALVIWPLVGPSADPAVALVLSTDGPEALLGRLWVIGAVLTGLHVLVGHARVRSLRRRTVAAPPALLARFDALRSTMGLPARVRLALSPDAVVPLAVGILRPAVLLPPALLLRLPADQVDALIAHELAHLRRLDPLVAAAQGVVEAVYFFHPAAWWISAQVRRERELCCDRIAAERCGDPIRYARALLALAESRLPLPVPAADGGSLMDRIATLTEPRPPRRRPLGAAVVLLALGLVSAAWAGADTDTDAGADLGADVGADAGADAGTDVDVPAASADVPAAEPKDQADAVRAARADQRARLEQRREELRQGRVQLREELRQGRLELSDTRRELLGQRGRLEERRQAVKAKQGELEGHRKNLEAKRGELEGHRKNLEAKQGELEGHRRNLEAKRGELEGHRRNLEAKQGELEGQRGRLEARRQALELGQADLQRGRVELQEARRELLAQRPQPAPAPAPRPARQARLRATPPPSPLPPVLTPPPLDVTLPLPPLPPMPTVDASFSMVSSTPDGERVVVQQHLVGDRAEVARQLRALLDQLEATE